LTISFALTALTLGLTTTQASAQQRVLKGTFELPAAAYWGDTLLQAGHYNIWMSTEARDIERVMTIRLSGEGTNATFLAIATAAQESGRNYLDVANVGGTYVVRAFDAGLLGRSFAFGVTKNVRNKTLRASAEPAIAVPVSTGTGN
jgi:hypothetical protein